MMIAQRPSPLLLTFGLCLSTLSCSSPPSRNSAELPNAPATGTPAAASTATGSATAPAASAPAACNASKLWVTEPNPPTEIGGGVPIDDETNCQFQQFAWQWFLGLVAPSKANPAERVFETYPAWLGDDVPKQCTIKAVTGKNAIEKALFARDFKETKDTTGPVLPTELKQATGGVLYDQARNVVLYNVRYSPNECQATGAGFLPNTIEIKTAWRIMSPADPQLGTYYALKANVVGFKNNPQTLGLVGFHLVINTKNHPEFVWATFEHLSNAPTCAGQPAAPAGGWSFASAAAASCLAQGGLAGCAQYGFNVEETPGGDVGLTGTPDEVCRLFPDGTDPASTTGENNNDVNRANIDRLNAQLVGPSGYLTQLPGNDPMAVWKNYSLIGSLWTKNGADSDPVSNQRGSLELANMTMETNDQVAGHNCLKCHSYNSSNPLGASHIYGTLAANPPKKPTR